MNTIVTITGRPFALNLTCTYPLGHGASSHYSTQGAA